MLLWRSWLPAQIALPLPTVAPLADDKRAQSKVRKYLRGGEVLQIIKTWQLELVSPYVNEDKCVNTSETFSN